MKHTTILRKISTFIAIITSFIIVACGGGGGGEDTPTPTVTPTVTTENFVVTPELTELDEISRTIKYTLNIGVALDRRLVISYEATNDTAQSGKDFTATKGTATIDIGETSATFSVTIIDDNVVEQTEQFSIALSDLKVYKMENGAFILENNSALKLPTAKLAPVKIRDTDRTFLNVSFPSNLEIAEGESLVVTVTSPNPIEVKDGLQLNYTGVPSSEFIISGDRIASGASNTELKLLARADGKNEPTETFEFRLEAIDSQAIFGRDGVIRGLPTEKKIITVENRLTVGFIAPAKRKILENGKGMLTFKVGILSDKKDETYDGKITLDATTSLTGGSAGAEDLKTFTGKTAMIARGETSADLEIAITDLVVDDNLVELSENFFIELNKGATLPDVAISTEQNRTEVEILNDDTAEIGFADDNSSDISEGATATLRVSTTNNIEGDLGLRYTVGGTAQPRVDYEELSGITNNGNIVIKTKLDSDVEKPETIDLTLSGVSDAFKVGTSDTNALSISATDATAQVKITDTPIVSIVANQTINEATPMLQIVTSATIDEVITVNLSIESGTAIAGKDFKPNAVIGATIPANATSATINLNENTTAVTSDNIVELDETINIVIAKQQGSSANFEVNPDSAKNRVAVTLRSEDRATLEIIAGDRDQSVDEGKNANIVVASSNRIDIGEDLVINYIDEGIGINKATRNTDYALTPARIIIKQGESSGTLVLESKFDNIDDATEGVKIQIGTIQNTVLKNNTYNNYVSIADASVSTITIRDRNTLRLVTNTVTEKAGIVNLTLQLDRAVTDSTTEVAYEVTTDTAGALDFDATNGTVTIKGGQTSTTFEIAIKDDEIVEKTETFEVILKNLISKDATGMEIKSSVVLAETSYKVEIRDNDKAQISISPSSLEIAEGGEATSITIATSKKIAEDVTIDIVVSGTAKAGAGKDYTTAPALANQVILTKDTTSVTISLKALDDNAIEGDETVIVTLSRIADTAGYEAGALTIDQAKKETVATIKDEDGLVKLSIEPSKVTTDEGNSGLKSNYHL